MLKWLDTREVDALADAVVDELRKRVPPAGLDLAEKKTAAKALRALENLYSRIASFARSERPNVYKKARFGNRVRWKLRESGYPQSFAETVTHEFVKYLALSSSTRNPG